MNVLLTNGTDLYVGGQFSSAGGQPASRIARWNGTTWNTLGTGVNNQVFSLAIWNGDLIVGGGFTSAGGAFIPGVARWSLSSGGWSSLGSSIVVGVNALISWNGDLIAGGNFASACGTDCVGIAKWNGTAWVPLGTGGLSGGAFALIPWNGSLIVGGGFTTAGGLAANNIASWDGAAWHTLGAGVNNRVDCMAVLPSGDLIVGGNFTTAGGAAANHIARWNGTTWSTLGAGANADVNAMVVLPGGDLAVGGLFTSAGGQSIFYLARWSDGPGGGTWSPIGSGMSAGVLALAPLAGGDLIAGGGFLNAGGTPANYIARWSQPGAPTISAQPANAISCPTGSAPFSVGVSGTGPFTEQWQIQTSPGVWATLGNDPMPLACGGGAFAYAAPINSPTVQIGIHACAGVTHYQIRCVVANACGSVTSDEATYTVCRADYNCDGTIAPADVSQLVNVWAASLQNGDLSGDFDGNGVVQPADVAAFVATWFNALTAGC